MPWVISFIFLTTKRNQLWKRGAGWDRLGNHSILLVDRSQHLSLGLLSGTKNSAWCFAAILQQLWVVCRRDVVHCKKKWLSSCSWQVEGYVGLLTNGAVAVNAANNTTPDMLNIAKGTTDPRVEFITQVQTQILIKFHLQNLGQASTSKSQPNISLFIKRKLQNLNQT